MFTRLLAIRGSFLRPMSVIRFLIGLALLIAGFPIVKLAPSVASSSEDVFTPGDNQPMSPNDNDPVVARELYPQSLFFDEDGYVTTPIVVRSYDLDVSRIYATIPTKVARMSKPAERTGVIQANFV